MKGSLPNIKRQATAKQRVQKDGKTSIDVQSCISLIHHMSHNLNYSMVFI